MIDMDSDAPPICNQLWEFLSKSIDEVVRIITPFLKLADVEEKICHHFAKFSLCQKNYCMNTLHTAPKPSRIIL